MTIAELKSAYLTPQLRVYMRQCMTQAIIGEYAAERAANPYGWADAILSEIMWGELDPKDDNRWEKVKESSEFQQWMDSVIADLPPGRVLWAQPE